MANTLSNTGLNHREIHSTVPAGDSLRAVLSSTEGAFPKIDITTRLGRTWFGRRVLHVAVFDATMSEISNDDPESKSFRLMPGGRIVLGRAAANHHGLPTLQLDPISERHLGLTFGLDTTDGKRKRQPVLHVDDLGSSNGSHVAIPDAPSWHERLDLVSVEHVPEPQASTDPSSVKPAWMNPEAKDLFALDNTRHTRHQPDGGTTDSPELTHEQAMALHNSYLTSLGNRD